ncbi:SAM-dependent methyltransferase [Luteolibacter ambystomatis]|uniref:SAM-dependent methyltransferase n=1 Tax=Luteolibacter ambystomatis TaxID=2824561 RepID=A0A975PFE7_9BACT|nr:SAM-dependent methyltransferase [Luteolibacter ambystomatis]QUE51850.1 SAM-dependent methyltransferase [Luteolibacter ambystomatis]
MPESPALPWPWTDGEALRFDRFMDRALHDPRRGYYARRIRGVGRGGDFTTTPMLSGALARAIAAWIAETGLRNVIEIGPGEGRLAADVMKALPWWTRLRTKLHLVEKSLPLREKQQALLGKSVHWHDTMAEALEACDHSAAIYSNELIDAFPVRRFRRTENGWDELFLLPDGPTEDWQPADKLPCSTSFKQPHAVGQIIEVHESARDWINEWISDWVGSEMLVIDYGDEAETLYHRRPHGTLRGYLMQQRVEGPAVFQHAGRQDLTADVNFTDLDLTVSPWAKEILIMTQRDFLLPHIDPLNPVDEALVDPEGAGSAFKVLRARATF